MEKPKKSKEEKLATFLDVYYNGDEHDWKMRRLPNWMNFYGRSLKQELHHKLPSYYRKFNQGTIVMVNYGVTVGSEMGGQHFAVVLTANDTKYKRDVVVVPLSSKYHKGYVDLGFDLLSGAKALMNDNIQSLFHRVNQLQLRLDEFNASNNPANLRLSQTDVIFLMEHGAVNSVDELNEILVTFSLDNSTHLKTLVNKIKQIESWETQTNIFKFISFASGVISLNDKYLEEKARLSNEQDELKELTKKIDRYNKKSYANVSAIRSISKLRVAKLSKYSITGNVRISPNSLAMIKHGLSKIIDL